MNHNKGVTFPAEIYTHREINRALVACGKGPTGERNRAFLSVLWRSGLRCSEALNLYPKDLDEKEGTLTVLCGKGGKRRVAGLDSLGWAALNVWLAERAKLGINGKSPVFCLLDGRPWASANVRQLFARIAKKAGIEKRFHPHGLRHTHATELVREGIGVDVVQAQLGHESLATTSEYVARLSPQKMVEAIRKRSTVAG